MNFCSPYFSIVWIVIQLPYVHKTYALSLLLLLQYTRHIYDTESYLIAILLALFINGRFIKGNHISIAIALIQENPGGKNEFQS